MTREHEILTDEVEKNRGEWLTNLRWWSVVRLSRVRRFLAAIASADFLAGLTIVIAILTVGASIVGGNLSADAMKYLLASIRAAWWVSPVLIVVVLGKAWLEYKRRTYDFTTIRTFQETFDAMASQREQAAKVCMEFLRESTMEHVETKRWENVPQADRELVEPILDFFTDLGFYLKGDQFSDEVVHHHFFHWVRGWFSVLKPYVDGYRRREPAAYGNVEVVYRRTAQIERQFDSSRLFLTTLDEKMDFLKSEGA